MQVSLQPGLCAVVLPSRYSDTSGCRVQSLKHTIPPHPSQKPSFLPHHLVPPAEPLIILQDVVRGFLPVHASLHLAPRSEPMPLRMPMQSSPSIIRSSRCAVENTHAVCLPEAPEARTLSYFTAVATVQHNDLQGAGIQ